MLCLTCAAFQFSNNLAVALAVSALAPERYGLAFQIGAVALLNAILILFMFRAQSVFKTLENVMKFMVGLVLLSFLINLLVARPNLLGVLRGLVPGIPEKLSLGIPKIVDGDINDPLVLIASLMGTTFSVAGAFFQGISWRKAGTRKITTGVSAIPSPGWAYLP